MSYQYVTKGGGGGGGGGRGEGESGQGRSTYFQDTNFNFQCMV